MSFISRYGAFTANTGAQLVLAANNERKGSMIVNNGSVTVYFGMDSSVTSSNGIPAAASGGVFNNSGQNEVYKGAIYAITGSSTVDLRYWEWGP